MTSEPGSLKIPILQQFDLKKQEIRDSNKTHLKTKLLRIEELGIFQKKKRKINICLLDEELGRAATRACSK